EGSEEERQPGMARPSAKGAGNGRLAMVGHLQGGGRLQLRPPARSDRPQEQ
ncbi:hypothetical protein GW17_00056506, partial [Ensete ventricosum]